MASNELRDTGLVQKFNLEALESNKSLEEKWKQYKKEYEELKTCLEEFPKELSAPIMMPLGSKVFVRAQLCNTNEVFIRYNDVITKQTAFEAKAVCERHIQRCDGMIENLTKEKNLLNDNLFARHEIINESSAKLTEIYEPYDEEKEQAWREVHKQKVKEYKQRLLEEEENKKAEDYKKALNEFPKAGVEKQISAYKNSEFFNFFEVYCGRNPKDSLNDSDDSSSSESSNSEDTDDDDDEDEEDFDDEDEDSKLEIVFSNDVPETTRNLKKKIKKTVSFNNDVQIKEFEPRPEEHFIPRKEENEKPDILVTQIEDIVERIPDVCLEKITEDDDDGYDEKNVRPISKFKAGRRKNNNSK